MKVLFLAPRCPVPADTGGKIRTFNLIKQVAKRHQVDLACFSFEEEDARYAKELENLGISVTLVPVRNPHFLQKVSMVLFASVPYSIAKYNSRKMDKAVGELAERNSYDIIHFDHIHMAHYAKYFDIKSCLVDEHNVEYRILERCADVEKSLVKKKLFLGQARKMKQFESRTVMDFPACSAVSVDDSEILSNLTGRQKSIGVLPNGVDTAYFEKSKVRIERAEDAVVFTGSMDWLPNDDAVVYFCEGILPYIWKTAPHVKFYIVGRSPSDRLKEMTKNEPRIILTGRVDDVRSFVTKAKVFVVPLRIGGGTRLKILEAMSMEKAVVSTTIGAEGIDYTEGKNIILADKPTEFAQKVITLMNDEQRCRTIGSLGRVLVMEKYDWDIVGRRLNVIYEKLKKKK